MCNIEPCNNFCHEEDLLCCHPLVHCCGGYSEHNNCCPHNKMCCNQGCGCCIGCDCCYKRYYKLLQEYKDQIINELNDIRIDVNQIKNWYELLFQLITEMNNHFTEEITNINNILSNDVVKKITLDSSVSETLSTKSYTPSNGTVKLPLFKQSDWNEEDESKWPYIKNKPTKLSDFLNDGFVKKVKIYDNTYSPSSSGTVTLPNITTGVKVGDQLNTPNNTGIVELPAYPTASNLDVPNKIQLSMSDDSYVLTAALKRGSNTISTSQVDLPLEEMIINADYDGDNKILNLILKNGNTIPVSISDIIRGLVKGVKIGTGSVVEPNNQGIIQLPAYPDITELNSNISADEGYALKSVTIQDGKLKSKTQIAIPSTPGAGDISVTIDGNTYNLQDAFEYVINNLILWKLDNNDGKIVPKVASRDVKSHGFFDTTV